jgi:hypothetical protein
MRWMSSVREQIRLSLTAVLPFYAEGFSAKAQRRLAGTDSGAQFCGRLKLPLLLKNLADRQHGSRFYWTCDVDPG